MPHMSVNKATSPPVETQTRASTETLVVPTGLKKMTSTYQLDATAVAFQPASLRTRPSTQPKFPRARPSKWNVQCRWTFERVGDCRYGLNCHWGHEGDEYLDEPGVKHTFKVNVSNGEVNGQTRYDQTHYDQTHYDQTHYYQIDRDQTHYDQVVLYNPSEYSAYSTSPGYPVQQNSDYGVHQYVNGPMPNFSWVGDATNVDGWLGAQDVGDHPVYEYIDIQAQNPAGLYGGAPVYNPDSICGNSHTEDQSENLVGTSTGFLKKKKKNSKRNKKAAAKLTGDKMGEAVTNGIALTEGQLQSIPTQEMRFETEGEKQLQGPHVEDTEIGRGLARIPVLGVDVEISI